jgi:Ca2+-binding EF-hand superfamily protein
MGGKAPVVRGAEKARTGREAKAKPSSSPVFSGKRSVAIPKWTVTDYKPPRKISDKELEMARKMFLEMDRDGSGSIDAEELGMMLRSLGQNPTEEELIELIDSVDDGDKDGQIQLREFLKLYTEGLDAKGSGRAGAEDVANVFSALGVSHLATLSLCRTPNFTAHKAPASLVLCICFSPLFSLSASLNASPPIGHRRVIRRRRIRRSRRRPSPRRCSNSTTSTSTPIKHSAGRETDSRRRT